MELEVYVPFFRSGREYVYLVADGLHEHLLQTYHAATTPVMIRYPVVSGPPKGWETSITVIKLAQVKIRSLFGLPHAGEEYPVLVPADNIALAELAFCIGITERLHIIATKCKTVEREQRIELRNLGISIHLPFLGRFYDFNAIDQAIREMRDRFLHLLVVSLVT